VPPISRERFDATAGGANVRDPLNNNVQVNGATSFTGGNPNVNPEQADTTTFGLVWQPSDLLQGFSASVDWYDINISAHWARCRSRASWIAAQPVRPTCASTSNAMPATRLCASMRCS
jgi:hypothetical protein